MKLSDCTAFLSKAPNPVHWLRLADRYLEMREKSEADFVLPLEHAVLAPIVDAFADNFNGFLSYTQALRDTEPRDGGAYVELNAIFRHFQVKAIQRMRRPIIARARQMLITRFELRYGQTLDQVKRATISHRVEQRWGMMRLDAAAIERNERKTKHLPRQDINRVWDKFWSDLAHSMDEGVVPLSLDPEQSAQLTEALYEEVTK